MSLTVDPCWCNSIYHPLPKLISTRTDVWPATFGLWWNTVWENGFCGSARNWAEDSQVHGKGPYGWVSGCQVMTPASLVIQLWVWPLLWQLLPSWPSTNTAPRPPPPPGTWLLHQYRTGNRSAHASAHEVTSLRPEEVSFGRTEASRRLNLSFHELCPLPRHTPHPRIPRWYF